MTFFEETYDNSIWLKITSDDLASDVKFGVDHNVRGQVQDHVWHTILLERISTVDSAVVGYFQENGD